jgi:protein SCO1/2
MRTRALAALVACLGLVSTPAGAEPVTLPALQGVFVNPAPAPLADFTLTDHLGRARNFSSLRGNPALVFFGFAHCPNICATRRPR